MPRKKVAPPPRVHGTLGVDLGAGVLGNPRWMALLAALGEHGSITAAAKAVELSYKAAWDAIDAMNNLADQPLVARAVGGKGGGGTTLTARGTRLVATYRLLEQEHARFLARLNQQLEKHDVSDAAPLGADLQLIGRLHMRTSARNHFTGTVVRIQRGAVNDEITLQLPGGDRLCATITQESTQTLGLKEGAEAVALIKASWVLVAVDDGAPLKLSARNQLRGTVHRLTPGAVNTEVVIALAGSQTVAAIITREAAEAMQLAVGQPAIAIFKASSVILGASQ